MRDDNAQLPRDASTAARLPVAALALWALLAVVVPVFSQALNLVDVLAFPLGYFMIAQGSLVGFLIIGIISARWRDRRDAHRATDG